MRSRPHNVVGTSGVAVAVGVTGSDATDALLVPIEFVAATLNVYATPLVKPRTMQVSAPVDVQVFDSGFDVAMYEVIVRLPLSSGASQYKATN